MSSKPHFVLLLHCIIPFALCWVYKCQFLAAEILNDYMERYLEENKKSLFDIQGGPPFPIGVLKYLISKLNTYLIDSFEDMNTEDSRQFVHKILEIFSQFCKENLIPFYEVLLEELIDEHQNRKEIFDVN